MIRDKVNHQKISQSQSFSANCYASIGELQDDLDLWTRATTRRGPIKAAVLR